MMGRGIQVFKARGNLTRDGVSCCWGFLLMCASHGYCEHRKMSAVNYQAKALVGYF